MFNGRKGSVFAKGPDTVLETQDTRGIDELEGAILSGDVNKVREMTLADEQLLVELVNQKEDLLEKMKLLSKHENESTAAKTAATRGRGATDSSPTAKSSIASFASFQPPYHMQSNSLHKDLIMG